MNAFIASLQFMTAIPLGKPRPFDPKGIIIHFPLAGLAIGLTLALFDLIASAIWPPLVASALEVVLLAAITGAFHLDGLADMADGLYGHREREKVLAIMKDSRVGPWDWWPWPAYCWSKPQAWEVSNTAGSWHCSSYRPYPGRP
jgi:adenosylcobinamide-GDP ribazoletransferase